MRVESAINDIFDTKRNSLNAIRLFMASSVIVSHSWLIGGYGAEPSLGGATIGTWSVIGFFTLSGYLITRSRLAPRPVLDYYRNRILRIYPGFLACLVLTAFVFAPLAVMLQSGISMRLADGFSYVVRNLPLYAPKLWQRDIGDTLSANPYPNTWNGPLWTLFWEAACYVFIGVLVSLVSRRLLPYAIASVFLMGTFCEFASIFGLIELPDRVSTAIPLIIAFCAGALVLLFGNQISLSTLCIVLSIIGLACAVATGTVTALGSFPICILLLFLGRSLPLYKVGAQNDISYGMYIYGWPVQQLLVIIFPNVSLVQFISLSVLWTVPLACLSWFSVESPAQKLKW